MSNEEILKIVDFINSCNEMIEGKFILADVKIKKILNKVEQSDVLFSFITNCLNDFEFDIELQRAEVKNRFNGGNFNVPTDKKTFVALVFCLLVAFDTKKIDFYQFIKLNFETLAPNGEYVNFAKSLLIPFRDCISEEFGILSTDENYIDEKIKENDNNVNCDETSENENQEVKDENDIYSQISKSVDLLIDAVYIDKKIKEKQKQELIYILNSAKYCLKYEDMHLVSAYITCFDCVTDKIKSINLLLNNLKTIIKGYYDNLEY